MQSVASTARRAIAAERSIRVLVSPTPITFAERRSVLQVLEQYGPIEVFRMTPGYHGNFISVTKNLSTAKELLARSPLAYRMPAPKKPTDINIADLVDVGSSNSLGAHSGQPSMVDSAEELDAKDEGPTMRSEFARPDASEGSAMFRLEIYPEPDYNHEHTMSASPLYHAWPHKYVADHPHATSILKHSLPQNMASEGLARWPLSSTQLEYGHDRRNERLHRNLLLPSKILKSDFGGGNKPTSSPTPTRESSHGFTARRLFAKQRGTIQPSG
ncbi:hypothetical protein E4U17_007288 [Claviceps sp. LM77 group G4]|nr:hypothetical protein E4U17_007288 [Claviceps sp. LM77 group G4]KAG6080186.1 hypothetical protein E4U16_000540 [Claviceps sp. LM84 group G4]KAG6080437.1 hypothetical protein E4U33_007613 [Claviceps sp. LM78 group G4]